MIRDLKYMIFGGIKYRLRGFLIGFTAGVILMAAAPSFISDLIPSANAAATVDISFVPPDSPYTPSKDYLVQAIEVEASGSLTSVSIEAYRNSTLGTTPKIENFYIYRGVGDLNTDSVLVYTDTTDVPISGVAAVYQTYTWTLSTSLDIWAGERYFLVWHDSNSFNGTITTASFGYQDYDYSGNYATCDTLWTGCIDFSTDRVLSIETYLELDNPDFNEEVEFYIENGPYLKSEWSAEPSGYYLLDYSCTEAGILSVKSLDLLDTVYNYRLHCDPTDEDEGKGVLQLGLDTDETTDWSLKYITDLDTPDVNIQYDIIILHEDIWTTYVGLGGDADDGGIVAQAIGTVWDYLKSIPIYGDVIVISDMVVFDFFFHLNSADYTGEFTIDGSFMGVTINETYNIEALAATVGDSANAVNGFEAYKGLITSMLLFSVAWSLWHNFSRKHGD